MPEEASGFEGSTPGSRGVMQGHWHPLVRALKASEDEPEQWPAAFSGFAMHRQGATRKATAMVVARRSASPRRHAVGPIPSSLALLRPGGK